MTASVVLLIAVLLLSLLAVAGACWGADSRAPGGWGFRRDAGPLWPSVSGHRTPPTADRADARR